jgi:two-component system, chemotaxis family, chemotaxis protein CheY
MVEKGGGGDWDATPYHEWTYGSEQLPSRCFSTANCPYSDMLKDKLVLLVDDNPAMLKATFVGLQERGFTVEAVDGAEEALRRMHSLKPSIVVSDLVMPGTNGFEFFESVRKEKEFTKIPFVFLTGIDDYHARQFGKRMGSTAYITKPVDLDELEQIIKDNIGE